MVGLSREMIESSIVCGFGEARLCRGHSQDVVRTEGGLGSRRLHGEGLGQYGHSRTVNLWGK